MVRNIPAFRNHWLILAAAVVLLVVTLIAGSLFAANDGSNPDAQQITDTVQVQPDETEPHGIAEPAPAEKTEMPQTDPGSGLNQVASGDSDALTVWLAAQPEVMGPFTVEQAMEADSETVSWILYQAVHKQVMTSEEAETFLAWYAQRPDSQAAPELSGHQPVYLDRLYDRDRLHELFRETESR